MGHQLSFHFALRVERPARCRHTEATCLVDGTAGGDRMLAAGDAAGGDFLGAAISVAGTAVEAEEEGFVPNPRLFGTPR